jgi:hypothetical protein
MNPIAQRLAHITMMVATLAAGVMVQPSQAADAPVRAIRVVELPPVVVTAKRIRVVQLDPVVVTAKRINPAATLLAQRGNRGPQASTPAGGRV